MENVVNYLSLHLATLALMRGMYVFYLLLFLK
jgi:hypothetical protein